jgi:hypothetical protein
MVPIPDLPEEQSDAPETSRPTGPSGEIDTSSKPSDKPLQKGDLQPVHSPDALEKDEGARTHERVRAKAKDFQTTTHDSGGLSTEVQQSDATEAAGTEECPTASSDSPRKNLLFRFVVGAIVSLVIISSIWVWYRQRANETLEPVTEKEKPGTVPADLPRPPVSQQAAEDDSLMLIKDAGFCIQKNLSARFGSVCARIFEDIFSLKENTDFANRAMSALGLKEDVIAATILSGDQTLGPAILVLDLGEQQRADQLNVLGQPLESDNRFNLRQISINGGQLAFVTLGERRVVIGREDAIKQLWTNTQSSPLSDIWRERTKDNVICLATIRGSALGNRSPVWWFDPWPDVGKSWRTIWDCTDVFVVSVKPGEKQIVCSLEWIAKGSQEKDSLEKNVRTLFEAAVQYCEARLSVLTNEGKPTSDANNDRKNDQEILSDWLSILKTVQVGVTNTSVTLSCSLDNNKQWDGLTEKLVDVVVNEWQSAAGLALEGYHGRWGKAMGQYETNHQTFPMAAGGGALLPPETRISWIASLLTYMDREDWAKSLHLGYSWNSPQNRTITQRYLPDVTNPLLGPTRTVEGYYDSHFAGVTGVGTDSAELPPGHPRAGVFNYRSQVRASDIKDGLSNTMAILGVERELGPWAAGGKVTARALTKPPYVNGPDGFGSAIPGGMLATMADGSVRFIRKDIDPRVLEQLATIAGGEPVTVDLLEPKASLVKGNSDWSKRSDEDKKDGDKPTSLIDILAMQSSYDPCGPNTEKTVRDVPSLHDSLKRPLSRVQFRTSLALAMNLFTQWSNVPLALDPESAEWLRISGQEDIEIDVKDTTFEDLAISIAKQFGLSVMPCRQSVVLVLPDRMSKRVRYEWVSEDTETTNRLSIETMQQVCGWFNKSTIPEEITRAVGSDAGLVIEGPFRVVLEIRRLLPGTPDEDTSDEQADEGQGMISLNFFEPTRLIDIAVTINRTSENKVFFDWTSLSQIDITPDTDVSVSASGEPLPDVLTRLAESIQGEVQRLPGGAFLVCAPHRYPPNVLRLYFAEDLLAHGVTPGQLRERIVKECAPESWTDAGGKGMLLYDVAANGFVVLNSPTVHQELKLWFEKQRQNLRSQ